MPTFKQLRKQRIREQLKEQKVNKMSKTLAEQYSSMSEEDWDDELAEAQDNLNKIQATCTESRIIPSTDSIFS